MGWMIKHTPGLLRLPPCSPCSTPLRAASGGGLWPGLTQAARDGVTNHGRDGETALSTEQENRSEDAKERPSSAGRKPSVCLAQVDPAWSGNADTVAVIKENGRWRP